MKTLDEMSAEKEKAEDAQRQMTMENIGKISREVKSIVDSGTLDLVEILELIRYNIE